MYVQERTHRLATAQVRPTEKTVHPVQSEPKHSSRLSRRAGFWAIAASVFVLAAFSTAPSPLYGLYQRQEGLSSITITFVYAVYAAGIVVSLLLVGHLSDWYGRRTILIPALATALAAALVFTLSTSLPALIIGRVLTGVALGAALATATAYLTDLDPSADGTPTRRSQIVGTVANVGGLAAGPLFAGLLAQFVPERPRLPYAIFVVLLTVALVLTALSPEGRPVPQLHPRYRPQRLSAPADARAQFTAALTGAFMIFTVFGLFAGLSGAFLAGPLHHPSPVWSGLAVFVSFGVGALTQVSTTTWSLRRLLLVGAPALVLGLAAVVAAAWVQPPSLALFFVGAVLVGIGSGTIYRGSLTLVVTTSSSSNRAGALASFFVVGYVGISIPVVGAGIALQSVSFQVTVLVLAAAVALGSVLAARVLLRLPTTPASGADRDAPRD